MNLMNLTNPDFLKRPEDIPLADLDCYRPPITAIISDWETKFENDAVEAVIRYGFDINKEELEKALNYDRGQYEKGYADAKRKYARPTGEWVETEEPCGWSDLTCYECSICKHSWALGDLSIEDVKEDFKFCPNCGAKMTKGETEG